MGRVPLRQGQHGGKMKNTKARYLALFLCCVCTAALISCKKESGTANTSGAPATLEDFGVALETTTTHVWYELTASGFSEVSSPKYVKDVFLQPWTEVPRIASAASIPPQQAVPPFDAYALVNKRGLLCFKGDDISFFEDDSLFASETADALVFSDGKPVFYLYRSTFFNQTLDRASPLHEVRPFLAEFDPSSRIFYPLVSYANLGLDQTDQVAGYFWDGQTWACAAKKPLKAGGFEFTYFYWQPLVALSQIAPAIAVGQEFCRFTQLDEAGYKALNAPRFFADAPEELRSLLASVPEGFSFHVSWRDGSGVSPQSYLRRGDADLLLSCHGGVSARYCSAVFVDGSVYVQRTTGDTPVVAFRLPKLPAGFSYGEQAVAGGTLYVAWEETSFFKTGRAGFIKVHLSELLDEADQLQH